MEELLKQQIELLKKIAAPKESYQIILSDNEMNFTTRLDSPIYLDKDKSYEIALVSLETYYSFPNVDHQNNVLYVRETEGDTHNNWQKIVIPTGAYELDSLNDKINELLKDSGYDKVVTLTADLSTMKCEMKIEEGFAINFKKPRSLRNMLGYSKGIYETGTHEAKDIIDIMNINSIQISIDIITGSYIKGSQGSVIYSFFPDISPGHKIVEKPHNLVYLPVISNPIDQINIKITDQDGNELNNRGDEITLRFHLRQH